MKLYADKACKSCSGEGMLYQYHEPGYAEPISCECVCEDPKESLMPVELNWDSEVSQETQGTVQNFPGWAQLQSKTGEEYYAKSGQSFFTNCHQCMKYFNNGHPEFAPQHTPSTRCQSGKMPHCTCDFCF